MVIRPNCEHQTREIPAKRQLNLTARCLRHVICFIGKTAAYGIKFVHYELSQCSNLCANIS